jgi:hypothetical protein
MDRPLRSLVRICPVAALRIHLLFHGTFLRGPFGSSEYSSAGAIHSDQGKARVETARPDT